MIDRKKYISSESDKILKELKKDYALNDEDGQFNELLKGIALIHASNSYDINRNISGFLHGLKYNLDSDFRTPSYGVVECKYKGKIKISKDFTIRSKDSIYKTVDDFNVCDLNVIHTEIISGGDECFLSIKLSGDFAGNLNIFMDNDLLNYIFVNKDQGSLIASDGLIYEYYLKTYGDLFSYLKNETVAFLLIKNVQATNKLTIKIPISRPLNNLSSFNIFTNCILVVNRFFFTTPLAEGVLFLPHNFDLLRVLEVFDKDGNIISNISDAIEGWYITYYNEIYYANITGQIYASVECCSVIPDSSVCESENYIPANLSWKKKPIAIHYDNLLPYISYASSTAESMLKILCQLSSITIYNVSAKDIVIEKYWGERYIGHIGYELNFKTESQDFMCFKYIKKQIEKYHLVKFILENKTGIFEV